MVRVDAILLENGSDCHFFNYNNTPVFFKDNHDGSDFLLTSLFFSYYRNTHKNIKIKKHQLVCFFP